MARRGLDQVTVRLEDEVLRQLRETVGGAQGRAGGLALHLRRLVYQDLGLPMPPQYGREEPLPSPTMRSRVEHWLEAESPDPTDLKAAAELLARAAGHEVLSRGELDRLRDEARQARTPPPAPAAPPAPSPSPAGPPHQEGRRQGLLEAADWAAGMARQLRGEYGQEMAERVAGLEAAADFARRMAGEVERVQAGLGALAEQVRGTRYADPGWLRTSARHWQARLRINPEDPEARRDLARIERIAEALGVELPAPPKPRKPRRTARK